MLLVLSNQKNVVVQEVVVCFDPTTEEEAEMLILDFNLAYIETTYRWSEPICNLVYDVAELMKLVDRVKEQCRKEISNA